MTYPTFRSPAAAPASLARLPQHAVTSCPARHASTRRVPDICNMHHTLFFVLHTHRDCGGSSLADLRQRPRRPAPSTRDGDALGPGRGTGCHPGTFVARRMWAIRPRAWAWGVARAGDTLLLALGAGADAGADVVISDLHVCACSTAVRGRFGRRGLGLRCVLLRALLFCAAWRCVALLTTSRRKACQEGTMVRCEN